MLYQPDFPLGWQPSSDLVKGPRTALLRADNLVWDEAGIISLRLGSQTLNPNKLVVEGGVGGSGGDPIPMVSSTSSVHSLFTTTLSGTRYRCAGVDNQAFSNFGSFGSFDGSGDIHFGSHQGHILATRGNTHWKWNGATRRWGIDAPTQAPTLTVLEPRVITVSTFDGSENALWLGKEGTANPIQGQDGTTDGAKEIIPSSTTGRGTIERDFSSPQNYDSFDSGAASGAPEDAIEFYVWNSHPEQVEYISIAFNCNPDSVAPFQDDYFYFELSGGDAVDVKLDKRTILDDRPDVEGPNRDKFLDDFETERRPPRTRMRKDASSANAGWSKFRVLRGQMLRSGSTPGTDWSTINAVQLSVKVTPATDGTVGSARFDAIRILGGSDRTLTGRFQGKAVWARDFGNYVALSGPSAISDDIECRNNGLRLTVPAAASAAKDSQLNESGGQMWAYLGGGSMRSFYRFATTSANGSGAITASCVISERDAILTDLTLESNNQIPPNNIISIVGPHYNCTVVATSTQVWVSRNGNPDSFWASLDVSDPSETILWMIKAQRGIIIATTKDNYELVGSLAELPDGEIDARLEPMGVNGPAISEFVVQDGGIVVYLAADGFRLLEGTGSVPINWNLDLLIQGYTRYGISPLNLGSAPGRFRGGISNGRLYVLTCETQTTSSPLVYVADLHRKLWRRCQYPRSFQVVYREPDGKVLAGDSSGVVWQLEVDTSETGDQFGVTGPGSSDIKIPVVLWTKSDDADQPIQMKQPFDWRAEMYTGTSVDVSATVELYYDEALTPQISFSAQRTSLGVLQKSVGDNAAAIPYRRVQTKITGSFYAFKLAHIAHTFRERPAPLLYWDSSLLDFGTQDIVWFRELAIKARSPVNLVAQVKFDGEARTLPNNGAIAVRANVESVYTIPIGRECKGRLPLIIITPISAGTVQAPNGFEPYYLRAKYKTSGGVTEKTFKIHPASV